LGGFSVPLDTILWHRKSPQLKKYCFINIKLGGFSVPLGINFMAQKIPPIIENINGVDWKLR